MCHGVYKIASKVRQCNKLVTEMFKGNKSQEYKREYQRERYSVNNVLETEMSTQYIGQAI